MRIRPRTASRGFTLVELLVVIGIISVLAGLLIPLAGMARRKANMAKARSNIAALCTALEAYNTLTGVYPGAGHVGAASDKYPEDLFRALYTGNPKSEGSRENHMGDWPPESLGKWSGGYLNTFDAPTDADLDFTSGQKPNIVFLDPWGRAFHYVEYDSRAAAQKKVAGGSLMAKGGQRYAIWSDGPDMINDWGKNDDVTSWTEGSGTNAGTKK
ncbi:MAG TPA: prepilin-type N-terminal cleavage/methylation domain-containing protein [Planctomycetota bacterium]|nr:prepilin-type N-terminal cleavage/methylation domain-containing protein [Planctomycetota bacterium]